MKINLMDIMESLNSDNVEDAQAALHEWFVDQGKAVQARLSGQAVDEETINEANSDTLVLLRDPNDGYDEVWAFQSDNDAQKFIQLNQEYYEGGRYDAVAGDLARIITPEEMGRFSPPTQAAPAGILNDFEPDDEDDYDGGAFDQWLNANRDKYSVDTPDLSWGGEDSEDDDVEESDEDYTNTQEATQPTLEADLIAELNEAFAGLETVSDKLQNVEGAAVGEEGKLPVNTKDTVPHHKADSRQGGEPVEIKSDDHKGYDLEKAPAVKDAPVKHHVQNSKDDPKKVSAQKGALLNKMDGSVNTQSPISGKGAKGLKK